MYPDGEHELYDELTDEEWQRRAEEDGDRELIEAWQRQEDDDDEPNDDEPNVADYWRDVAESLSRR